MKRALCLFFVLVCLTGSFGAAFAQDAPIDLSAAPASAAGAGWHWDGARRQLTLSGLSLSVAAGAAVRLPAGASILYAGNNSIRAAGGNGVECEGSALYIFGQDDAATLHIQASGWGIRADEVTLVGNGITVGGAPAASGSVETDGGYAFSVSDGGDYVRAPYAGQAYFHTGVLYPVYIRVATGGGAAFFYKNFTAGQTVTIEARPQAGYGFVSWNASVPLADANAPTTTFVMPASSVSIYGNFQRVYRMTVAAVEGGTVTQETQGEYFAPGRQVILYAIPYKGYYFAGWTSTYGGFRDRLQAYTALTMPAVDTVVTPVFEKGDAYHLQVNTVGAGVVNVATGNFAERQRIFLSAVPAAGYVFSGWMSAAGTFLSSESAATYFIMPSQNTDVTAVFAPIDQPKSTLIVEQRTGGNTNIAGGQFVPGTPVTLAATPKKGYRFAGWEIVQTEYTGAFVSRVAAETEFIMPAADVAISARFALLDPGAVLFYCSVGAGEGGTVLGEGTGNYIVGYEIDIVAVPDDGYYFAGWKSAVGGSFLSPYDATTVFYMPANDTRVTAYFAPLVEDPAGIGQTGITPLAPPPPPAPQASTPPTAALICGFLLFGGGALVYAALYSRHRYGDATRVFRRLLRRRGRKRRARKGLRAVQDLSP